MLAAPSVSCSAARAAAAAADVSVLHLTSSASSASSSSPLPPLPSSADSPDSSLALAFLLVLDFDSLSFLSPFAFFLASFSSLSSASPSLMRSFSARRSLGPRRVRPGGACAGVLRALFGLVLDDGRVLEDEGAELVAHVHLRHRAARLAHQLDRLLLGQHNVRLRVVALAALHEALDEAFQQLRQAVRLVRAVHDGQPGRLLELGLRA